MPWFSLQVIQEQPWIQVPRVTERLLCTQEWRKGLAGVPWQKGALTHGTELQSTFQFLDNRWHWKMACLSKTKFFYLLLNKKVAKWLHLSSTILKNLISGESSIFFKINFKNTTPRCPLRKLPPATFFIRAWQEMNKNINQYQTLIYLCSSILKKIGSPNTHRCCFLNSSLFVLPQNR